MAGARQPYFVVATPFPEAAQVVCYRETWDEKLTPAGRVQPETRALVEATLSAPTCVCLGTSNPGYIAFVSQLVVSPGSGAPFVVFVDPMGDPLPAVASIGFRRDFRNLQKHTILWPLLPPNS